MLKQFQKIDRLTLAAAEVFYTWTVRGCERLRAVPSIRLLLKGFRYLFACLGRGLGFRVLAAYWAWLMDCVNEWVAEFEAVAQLDLKLPLGVWDVCRTKYSYHQNLQNQMLSLRWQLNFHLDQDQELASAMVLRKYHNHLLDVLEWANQIAERQRVIIQEGKLSKNLQALEDLKEIWRLLIEEEKRLNQAFKSCPVQR